MARYTGPVCRLCRREKTKLYLKGAKCDTMRCPIERRPTPPGDHGRDRLRQGSEYNTQLREKQKTRRIYGVLKVNGKRVTIPSYRVRQADVIELSPKAQDFIVIRHNQDTLDRRPPAWLETFDNGHSVRVLAAPVREQIDTQVREQLVVELYSK
jgi:small subunit ribosomal protein S4